MRRQADFTVETLRKLADRVQGHCSRPECRKPTKGPHTDDEKVRNFGKGAHIHAAQPGGARYKESQTPEERRSISNGIWLCSNCATEVDNDEERFPPELLRQWKSDAELEASLRLESSTPASILGALHETTNDLLSWPQTLLNDTWLERPEMAKAREALEEERSRPVVLLGPPGSGKSAFLARLGGELKGLGWHVVAIKADRLPRTVTTRADLRDYLGLTQPLRRVLFALGQRAPTVLLVDQLDALADLVDLHTDRLSVLLGVIADATQTENVRVMCSARIFDFQHDARFRALNAQEIRLSPVAMAEVERVLRGAGFDPQKLPFKLKTILQTPHWLKTLLMLGPQPNASTRTSGYEILDAVWEQKVLRPVEESQANDDTLSTLASTISEREELWIPRVSLVDHEAAIQRLLAAGVLTTDGNGSRVGFAHQSLYEFARARAFVARESLVNHALSRQDALFVRPAIWTALAYLRGVDKRRYHDELSGLWQSQLRSHLRLLVIEFVAQVPDPDEAEVALLSPVFQDEKWMVAAFNAASHSEGWRLRLRNGLLLKTLCGSRPAAPYAVLVSSLGEARDETVKILWQAFDHKPSLAAIILAVLMRLDDWSLSARDLASSALAQQTGQIHALSALAALLSTKRPDYSVHLIATHLTSEFERLKEHLLYTPPPPEVAPFAELLAWRYDREPNKTLQKFFVASSRISGLTELAKGAPSEFLRALLPWLDRVLDAAAEINASYQMYRYDRIVDVRSTSYPAHDIGHALRTAAEELGRRTPELFFELAPLASKSDLHSVHSILSYGLEQAAPKSPVAIADYLLSDPRRFCLNDDYGDSARSIALLRSISASLTQEQVRRIEEFVLQLSPWSESRERPVEARRAAMHKNRELRARLLGALPGQHLRSETAAMLEQEARALDLEAERPRRSTGLQRIVSPMSAEQMEKAQDDHIVNLFEELIDSTEDNHPRNWMAGGAVQAARELAKLAKKDIHRALGIVQRLRPEIHEVPVGQVVEAMSETSLSVNELNEFILQSDARGFGTIGFRTAVARALERHAGGSIGLPDSALNLLERWLRDVPKGPRTKARVVSEELSGEPPFLDCAGGGFGLPDGSYAILDTLLVALLSRKPPDTARFVRILTEHVERDEDPVIWKTFAYRLHWLRICDRAAAGEFLDKLLARYPEALEWRAGVELVAIASRWVDPVQCERWIRVLDDSPWRFAKHAQGELVAFQSLKYGAPEWAHRELNRMLSEAPAEYQIGVAHAASYLWHDALRRDFVAPVVVELLIRGNPVLDEAILRGIEFDELVGDSNSVAVLQTLVEREQVLPAKQLPSLVFWVTKHLHVRPDLVERFAQRAASQIAANPEEFQTLGWSLTPLVQISVSLQRLPAYRQCGLDLFEKLLGMNLHGAREVMEELDKRGSS